LFAALALQCRAKVSHRGLELAALPPKRGTETSNLCDPSLESRLKIGHSRLHVLSRYGVIHIQRKKLFRERALLSSARELIA
jgi:hypothetical protein